MQENHTLANVDLDDPGLLRDPACAIAIAAIAGHFVRREHDALMDALRAEIGEPLRISAKRIEFLGGALRVDLRTDGRRKMSILEDNGKRRSLDDLVLSVDNSGVTLENLQAELHKAALACVAARQLDRVRALAGVPDLDAEAVFSAVQIRYDHAGVMRLTGDHIQDLTVRAAGAIAAAFDPAIARLARKCAANATVADYNHVAANQTMARQFAREAQHMLPLINKAIEAGVVKRMDTETLKAIKEDMLRRGHSDAAWKALTRFRVGDMRWLAQNLNYLEILRWGGLVADTGEMPPMALLRRWIEDAKGWHYYHAILPPAWFRRAAARHAQTLPDWGALRNFLQYGDYSHALDWLRAATPRPDANQIRAGWSWIMRQTAEWTKQTQMRGRDNQTWDSLVPAYSDQGWQVVPLTSTEALVEEGQRMHHCVGSYDWHCVRGLSRVFSIRTGGQSQATVEIGERDGHWRVAQAKAACNAKPEQALLDVAKRLADRYDRAWQRVMQADAHGRPAAISEAA